LLASEGGRRRSIRFGEIERGVKKTPKLVRGAQWVKTWGRGNGVASKVDKRDGQKKIKIRGTKLPEGGAPQGEMRGLRGVMAIKKRTWMR